MKEKKIIHNADQLNIKYPELISTRDANILRSLAGRVAELASRDIEIKKRNLWREHNMLKPTRPLIYCDPENGWHEIITKDSYRCETPLAKSWEFSLRKEIFWGESIKDDKVIEPVFNINHVNRDSGWGLDIKMIHGEKPGSYSWDPPLKDYSDFDKLRAPEIIIDYDLTKKHIELAQDIFGDLLSVRLKSFWWWSLGMTEMLIYLRGIEDMMVDMCVSQEELHKLMNFLMESNIKKLDFLSENSLLSLNTDFYVGSGGFGYTDELPQKDFDGKNVRTMDMWGFAESQETSSVSAEMFEEFIFPYQLPLLEKFGLNCYGCCEPLDKRWHVVKKFPRLRRVSVSPWADITKMAEYLENKYVYSLKPNPTPLSYPVLDEERVRKTIRESIEITKGCCLEIIMKDTHTISNNPQNVINWTRIAMEEAGKI